MYLDVYNNHFRFIYNGQVQCEIACNSAGMTDNFFFGNYNKSGNGYNRLNNGFIIQWGRVAFSGKSTYITFPITFSSVFTVLTGVSNNSTDQYGDNNARDISNSGFTGWKYQEDAHTLFWLAVGI